MIVLSHEDILMAVALKDVQLVASRNELLHALVADNVRVEKDAITPSGHE